MIEKSVFISNKEENLIWNALNSIFKFSMTVGEPFHFVGYEDRFISNGNLIYRIDVPKFKGDIKFSFKDNYIYINDSIVVMELELDRLIEAINLEIRRIR